MNEVLSLLGTMAMWWVIAGITLHSGFYLFSDRYRNTLYDSVGTNSFMKVSLNIGLCFTILIPTVLLYLDRVRKAIR